MRKIEVIIQKKNFFVGRGKYLPVGVRLKERSEETKGGEYY